jgi:hypothetical protein
MPKPTSNRDIINKLYAEFKGIYSKELITEIVNDFFSCNGIRKLTRLKYHIDIPNFGRFFYQGDSTSLPRKLWANKLLFGKKYPKKK